MDIFIVFAHAYLLLYSLLTCNCLLAIRCGCGTFSSRDIFSYKRLGPNQKRPQLSRRRGLQHVSKSARAARRCHQLQSHQSTPCECPAVDSTVSVVLLSVLQSSNRRVEEMEELRMPLRQRGLGSWDSPGTKSPGKMKTKSLGQARASRGISSTAGGL